MKESWEKNQKIGKLDFFILSANKINSRLKESLLQRMIGNIKLELSIEGVDKKAGLNEVRSTMKNAILAKFICERIVKVAVEQYINIKTQIQKIIVDKLQARIVSFASLLSKKTHLVLYCKI